MAFRTLPYRRCFSCRHEEKGKRKAYLHFALDYWREGVKAGAQARCALLSWYCHGQLQEPENRCGDSGGFRYRGVEPIR
jgi:hypothetical protein